MTQSLQRLSLSLVALMALGACATDGGTSRADAIAETLADARVGEKVNRICFTRGIDSFSEEKRNSVVLRRGVNDEYLVVTGVCPNLEMAQSLRLEGYLGCLRARDYIRVFENAHNHSEPQGFVFDRCQIDEIYKWNDDVVVEAIDDEPAEAPTDD